MSVRLELDTGCDWRSPEPLLPPDAAVAAGFFKTRQPTRRRLEEHRPRAIPLHLDLGAGRGSVKIAFSRPLYYTLGAGAA